MDSAMLNKAFKDHFGTEPALVAASPGRINLIGEHVDYNGGFVLPAAIDKKIYVAIAPRNDDKINLLALDQRVSGYETHLHSNRASGLQWPDYILGVVAQCQQRGLAVNGFNLALTGDVPVGAGVSSSAAVECASLFALNVLFSLGLERKDIAQLAQRAENQFVGVNCGIMDQFASVMGKKDHVLKLNCDTLDYQYYPFEQKDIAIVLLDTQVKHSLASSAYNKRRQECEEGLHVIQKINPAVKALCQASLQELEMAAAELAPVVYQRCQYVIEEQARVNGACEDLTKGDLLSFGKKMYATHQGLSKLYEVSCEELDHIVEACQNFESVLGARVMGGGFGGCVIALVRPDALQAVTQAIGESYQQRFGKKMLLHRIQLGEGTSLQ